MKATTKVMQLLAAGRAHEDQIRHLLGGDAAVAAAVLTRLHKDIKARPVKVPSVAGYFWVSCDETVTKCPWSASKVLKEIAAKSRNTTELAKDAGSPADAMRVMLQRLQKAKKIKIKVTQGLRKWVPFDQYVRKGGERAPVTNEELLLLIQRHQPVGLDVLGELTGRGRIYLRGRVHDLRRAGLVKIMAKDGSWIYTLPDYVRSPADIGQEILLRCEDVGGDCLAWSGCKSAQGHPLMRHGSNNQRVDVVLWTAVHGKTLRPGHTLIKTCETPGCCNHAHHKQVTRGAAMKKAAAESGFGGAVHGRRVAEAIRMKRTDMLTAEQVQLIRTSALSGAELARRMGKNKSVVNSVRAGKSYRDYSAPANPFAGLM